MVLSPYYTGLTGKAASRLPSVTEIILPYNSKNSISRKLFMRSRKNISIIVQFLIFLLILGPILQPSDENRAPENEVRCLQDKLDTHDKGGK